MEPFTIGVILLAIWVIAAIGLMKGANPFYVFTLMTIAWAIVAGLGYMGTVEIIEAGYLHFAEIITTIMIAAWMGQVLIKTGITEAMIRRTAELAGDRPTIVGIAISTVTSLIFSSVYGIGPAIMMGIITLPILMQCGIPPRLAAALYTMGVGTGNAINPVQFKIFQGILGPELTYEPLVPYFVGLFIVFLITNGACAVFWTKVRPIRKGWSVNIGKPVNTEKPECDGACAGFWKKIRPIRSKLSRSVDTEKAAERSIAVVEWRRVPVYSFIAPFIPILAIVVIKWPLIPSFLLGIIYAIVTTMLARWREILPVLEKAFWDAFPELPYVAFAFLGVGCLMKIAYNPAVGGPIMEVLGPILPGPSAWVALGVAVAILLPLTLYGGPISIARTGLVIAFALLAKGFAPNIMYAIFDPALVAAGATCPTASWVIWTVGTTKSNFKDHILTVLPFVWIGAIIIGVLVIPLLAPH